MRPTPDQTAGCAHIGCGMWVGAAAGVFMWFLVGGVFEPVDLLKGSAVCAIGGALVCGWLAAKRRERFWDDLGERLDDEPLRGKERRDRVRPYLPGWWRWW